MAHKLPGGSAAVANRLFTHNRGKSTSAPAVTKNKKSALLVDDVKVTQKVTSVALHQSGFVCDVADDGEAAVAMATKNHYYVILMDVQLPKLDGVEATKLIRELERNDTTRIPTIIFGLTGNCKEEDLDRYNAAGMDGCIEKGCVVSRAMHEALAMKKENPEEFIFINSRNVQSIRNKKESILSASSLEIKEDLTEFTRTSEPPRVSAADVIMSEPSLNISVDSISNLPSSEIDSPSHHLSKVKTQLSLLNNVSVSQSPVLSGKRHALLVDDVKVTQRITSAALQKTGYLCDLASDGEVAVDMSKKNNYYVILMDVQLPVIDGVEATKLIRSHEKETGQNRCIIFGLTGNCSDEALQLYAEAGMDGCIEKGCVVSRAMHEALAMKEANPNTFLFIDSRNVHFKLLENKEKTSAD